MKKKSKSRSKRPGRLTALEMFKGDLLTADMGDGRYALFYLTRCYMVCGGRFLHFRAGCILAEADDHNTLVRYSESLIDDGGAVC